MPVDRVQRVLEIVPDPAHEPLATLGRALQPEATVIGSGRSTAPYRGPPMTCRLDRRRYPTGHKVSDAEIATVSLWPNAFHGEWNYAIRPHPSL